MTTSVLKLGVIIAYSFMVLHLLIACLAIYVDKSASEALDAVFQFFVIGLLIDILLNVKQAGKD